MVKKIYESESSDENKVFIIKDEENNDVEYKVQKNHPVSPLPPEQTFKTKNNKTEEVKKSNPKEKTDTFIPFLDRNKK